MWKGLFGDTLQKKEKKWEDFFARKYTESGPPEKTEPIIVEHLKDRDVVVFGARAMNTQVPPKYRRSTDDWDVKTLNPSQFVRKLEADLEKLKDIDQFYVEKLPVSGENFVVFRVKSRATGGTLVDASVPKKNSLPPYVIKEEIKYKTLEAILESKLDDLKNPEKRYRWSKDRRDAQRIKRAMGESVSTGSQTFTQRKDRRPWRLLGEIYRR